jgi:chromosome segregation ATPase
MPLTLDSFRLSKSSLYIHDLGTTMAFLAVAPVVIQLLSAAAPIAADIFKFCKDMYGQYKESKPPKAAASGENHQSEQLVHIKQEISELKGMMKDPSKSTLQCQEKISDVDKKLDQMTLEASELKGMVKNDLSELKRMMKDSTKSTTQCQEMISKLDKKLEEMTLEATGLKGIVEDLASSTMTGFERLDHAFSQV